MKEFGAILSPMSLMRPLDCQNKTKIRNVDLANVFLMLAENNKKNRVANVLRDLIFHGWIVR